MHRKKVLAGLFLTVGLTLTLLTPRSVRADDAQPLGEAAQDMISFSDELTDTGPPGSYVTPDDKSEGETTLGDGEDPGDPGSDSGGESQSIPGGNDPSGPDITDPTPPADPALPAEPTEPVITDDPQIPVTPGETEDPDDPETPGETENPDDPEKPGETEDPDDPETPGETEDPDDPETPGETEDPDDPETPGETEDPDDPETPGETEDPDDPEKPGETEDPDDPEKPEDVDKDAQTDKDSKARLADRTDEKKGASSPMPQLSVIPNLTTFPTTSGGHPVWSGNGFTGRGRYIARFVKVAKVYAIPKGQFPVAVREEMSSKSRAVGRIAKDGLVYILADEDEKWLYVESGDVRGFVLRDAFKSGDEVTAFVEEKGEENFAETEVLVEPSENKALTYTRTTALDSKGFLTELRAAIIEKSEEYLGGPYVWGGTSLTGGCDCSGFVQSLFGLFGVELPRTSREQAVAGEAIPVSEVEPGDLVFYETDGVVSHVMMAIGDGQAINAANSRAGIIISDIDEARAVRACRVLEASDGYTAAVDGSSYTEDELELIWAVVAQEDDTCYDGALAVISCAMNRADLNYGGYGTTALAQLTADGQFCYSPKISDPSFWMRRLNGAVPEFVKAAVSDCLTKGIRNNGYLNFRSGNRNGVSVPIGGNWYF